MESSKLDTTKDYRLRWIVASLYMAGKWECKTIDPKLQARMWEAVRDALGLEPGTATKAGVGVDKESE